MDTKQKLFAALVRAEQLIADYAYTIQKAGGNSSAVLQEAQQALSAAYEEQYAEYLSEQESRYEGGVAANYAARGQTNIY